MRLPDSSDCVASYDVLGLGASANEKTYVPRAMMFEGSIDGVNWREIDDYDTGSVPGGTWLTWRYSGETWSNAASCNASDFSTHTGGRPINARATGYPVPLVAVTNISVASGARFAVTGGTLDLPSGITLTVDGATGAGTIANMNLPASGTLDIVNMPSFFGVAAIPVTFENVEGVDNLAGWTLKVNGAVTLPNRMRAKVYGNNIILAKRGIAISIR